jgi:hypothetical protein
VSPPPVLNADSPDGARQIALLRSDAPGQYDISRTAAFRDAFADLMGTLIQDRRQGSGNFLGILNLRRVGKDNSKSVARRQDAAPTIQNRPSLRFQGQVRTLLAQT